MRIRKGLYRALALTALIGILFQARALAASEDLFIQTRLDQKSTSWLIDKIRLLLANSELSDGLSSTTPLSEDTVIPLGDFSDRPEFRKMKETISKIFKVDTKGAFLRIRIPKIKYKVHSLHARPEGVEVNDPSVRLKAMVLIRGVDIGLPDGVQLDFMVPNPKTGVADAYFSGFLKPVSVEVPEALEPAEFGVDLETIRDRELSFKLIGSKLDALPVYVDRHMEEIRVTGTESRLPVSANDLTINPVVVRLNSLSRSISFDEFKPLVQGHLKNILASVLKKVGSGLQDSIGPAILKTVFSQTLPGALSISSESFFSRFLSTAFYKADQDQLGLSITGELCTNELYLKFKEACASRMHFKPPVRMVPAEDNLHAREEVRKKISSGEADVALSVSEEYLNRVLQTSVDAKLWEEMLKEENLELGPKGAFVVLNEAGAAPEIYLDIVYRGGKGLQSVIINPRHPIRFPLRMGTKLVFEVRKEMPVMVISIEKLLSDAYEIINGIPEYDLPSDLVPGLRKKIASMILKMASEFEGKNAIEMELPAFKGLGLENTRQEPSAYGRLNLYFKL
jgi:hypothetical protein